jgi:hypothetical protein
MPPITFFVNRTGGGGGMVNTYANGRCVTHGKVLSLVAPPMKTIPQEVDDKTATRHELEKIVKNKKSLEKVMDNLNRIRITDPKRKLKPIKFS